MERVSDRNGSEGGMFITSAEGAVTNQKFAQVYVAVDGTTFSVFENARYSGADPTDITWNKGEFFYGLTTDITVTAGRVTAHTEI